MYRQELFQQRLEEFEVEGIGAVGLCIGRVVVDFKEDAVDARGNCGARQQGDELRLPAADAVGCRRLLHGMRCVKHDRGEAPHDRKGAIVDHQSVVTEAGAALGKEDALIAGGADLFHGVGHVPWGNELTLLDVDGATGFAGGHEEIGLAAKEGGNLQDVDGLGSNLTLGGFMDVG